MLFFGYIYVFGVFQRFGSVAGFIFKGCVHTGYSVSQYVHESLSVNISLEIGTPATDLKRRENSKNMDISEKEHILI